MDMRDLIPWRKRRRSPQSVDMAPEHERQDMFRDAIEDFFSSTRGLAPWIRRELGFGPVADISESDQEYRVEVELPGLKKDDLNVTVDSGRLHITGERRQEDKDEGKNYVRTERSYGSFSRTMQLPATVNEDEAEAEYKDGVLTVTLPKTPEARGKKIDVKASGEQ